MRIKAAVKLLKSAKEPNMLAVCEGEAMTVYSNGPYEKLVDLWAGVTDMLFSRVSQQHRSRLLEDLSSILEETAARYMKDAADPEVNNDQGNISGE